MMTSDGRPVSVVDPGKRNVDGGPDFKHATVRIGNTLYVGDVESVEDMDEDGLQEVALAPAAALGRHAQVHVLSRPERPK